MFNKQHLIRLTQVEMPFGKYKGRVILDLPEEYLLWFARKDFPSGELGLLMQIALEIKVEGLEHLVRPTNKQP